MKTLATLEITLQANGQELVLPRYEFNHALTCMGVPVTPYGTIPADEFRHRLTTARGNMLLHPREFTVCETTMRVGKKEQVTFAAMDAEKVRAVLTKLWVFAERAGDKDINY
jgi:hypothetical protein